MAQHQMGVSVKANHNCHCTRQHFSHAIIDQTTGQSLEYKQLLKQPTTKNSRYTLLQQNWAAYPMDTIMMAVTQTPLPLYPMQAS